jgi:hypothetical protein
MKLSAGILLIISLGFTLGPALHFFDINLNCCSTLSSCHINLDIVPDDDICNLLTSVTCCSSASHDESESDEDHNSCNPFHCFHCVKVFLTLNLEFSVTPKNILVNSNTPPYIPHRGIQYQLAVWHPPLFV